MGADLELDPGGDYLVITLGAELSPGAIPGLAEAGHNFYTLGGAETLRTALQNLVAGRVVVLTAAPAYKCPAAPYEGAMLIDAWCRRQGLRDAVQIEVYAAEPASPRTGHRSRQRLDRGERVDVGGSAHAADAMAQRLRDQRRRLDPVGARKAFAEGGCVRPQASPCRGDEHCR